MTRILSRGLSLCSFLMTFAVLSFAQAQNQGKADASRIHPPGEKPDDARLKPQRTLNDAYHPWVPPATKEAWEAEAAKLRRQLQVACGLWPMPERPAIQPVIHGLVDRDDYTIERVYFLSRPGMYVTGSLYRPKNRDGKLPVVLCPYGHWANGRFHDAGEKLAEAELESGAESFDSGARFPLQAQPPQLARMGCIVFQYDMIGVADNQPLLHREGFNDATAELWLQNKLGLQTWNSIRALDFVCSLLDVDASRIGVTGGSGGGTQTFMLCALDNRPTVAFPAVMVSTAMQGGCQCENASYLRVGTNNVAIAALTAPRPMKMSGANDWTIDIETKGLPELKSVYALFGKPELVDAKCYPEFGHNYNEISREMMFAWMAEHLNLGDVPVEQADFKPLPRDEMTVFTAEHPLPNDSLTADKLREEMTRESQQQFANWIPKSASDAGTLREVIGGAAGVMLGDGIPGAGELRTSVVSEETIDGVLTLKAKCGLEGQEIPTISLTMPDAFNGQAILWLSGKGKSHLFGDDGKPKPSVRDLMKAGFSVVSADVFLTGEFLNDGEAAEFPVDKGFPGYTFCYNRPLISERVRDILTLIASIKAHPEVEQVHLVGTGRAGLWALLARAVAGDTVGKTLVDLNGFRFDGVSAPNDPNLLPGALKYGDVDGFASIAAPGALAIYGATGSWDATRAMFGASNASLQIETSPLKEDVVTSSFR